MCPIFVLAFQKQIVVQVHPSAIDQAFQFFSKIATAEIISLNTF